MQKINILPNDGILVEGVGELHFGFSKANIILLLGEAETDKDNFFSYFENALHLVFDEHEKLILIDIRPSKIVTTRLFNRNVFNKNKTEILNLFASKNIHNLPDVEGYFNFPSVGISFSIDEKTTFLRQIILIYNAK